MRSFKKIADSCWFMCFRGGVVLDSTLNGGSMRSKASLLLLATQ